MGKIKFNKKVRLILADVDETIAGVYMPADPGMIEKLEELLMGRKVLFLVSGGGLVSIKERIIDFIRPELRHRIIVAHCMGAEVWGFDKKGNLNDKPYYGVSDEEFSPGQKILWHEIIDNLIKKYQLKIFPPQTKASFILASKGDPLSVIYADRGLQITLEFVNSINLNKSQVKNIEEILNIKIPLIHDVYDLRMPFLSDAENILKNTGLPIVPKLGGTMALDFKLEGVDKTLAIKYVLNHENILKNLDIHKEQIKEYEEIEIWGDRFAQKKGGADFDMCKAVSPKVRAIDFRKEDSEDLPKGYNIVIWDGQNELHEGLLEYLKS